MNNKMNVVEKILASHLVEGDAAKDSELGIHIDQTLTQDATGTMAYLQFESMGVNRVKTDVSVSYVDHNTVQIGFENADDHRFIQSVAKKRGIRFSRPGNGICHQVHLERFGKPGKTLIGSDSHTPTGGGIGMLAMGAGGLDVAVAMGGGAYYITMPKMIKVNLSGKLRPWVSAKDVSLEILRILSVKGGVGAIIVEVTCVDSPLGLNTRGMLVIDDDKYIPGMTQLADVIHEGGAKAFLQISHTGRGARPTRRPGCRCNALFVYDGSCQRNTACTDGR